MRHVSPAKLQNSQPFCPAFTFKSMLLDLTRTWKQDSTIIKTLVKALAFIIAMLSLELESKLLQLYNALLVKALAFKLQCFH